MCDPEHTDSHEDLIASRGLADNGRGGFVRVELTPGDDWADPACYTFRVDQTDTPDWWTDCERSRVEIDLRDRIRRSVIVDGKNKTLLGGSWIFRGDCSGIRLRNGRVRNANDANLRSANLQYADLQSADLQSARRLSENAAIPGWKIKENSLLERITTQ